MGENMQTLLELYNLLMVEEHGILMEEELFINLGYTQHQKEDIMHIAQWE